MAAARRADPGGAAGGHAGRQLQPGRRLERHLGAGRPGARAGTGPARGTARRARAAGDRARSARGRRGRPDSRAAVVLARIAESLFWIGRYLERADDTARILDAFLGRLLEDPWADEDVACREVTAILGAPAPHDGRLAAGDVLDLLAFDTTNASAIAGALAAARDNARGTREAISSEMWECLNVTWHTLDSQRRAAERLGLAESTMSRDDGWRFLVLGRSLERVDMTTRLLSIQASAAEYDPGWRTVLRACGADESFLRTHGGNVQGQRVAEFLLLDRLFPRSALHALTTAEHCPLGGRRHRC